MENINHSGSFLGVPIYPAIGILLGFLVTGMILARYVDYTIEKRTVEVWNDARFEMLERAERICADGVKISTVSATKVEVTCDTN
jgi:hypothetical protein